MGREGGVRCVARGRQLLPAEGEKGIAVCVDRGCAQLLGGDGQENEGVDGDDRSAGGVRRRQGHGVRARTTQPDAQRARAGRVDAHAGPGEGQPYAGSRGEQSCPRDGVQGGIEQCRVEHELRGALSEFTGEGDFDEDLVAVTPQGSYSLEGGPVVVALGGQVVVEPVYGGLLRDGGRPLGQLVVRWARLGVASREYALGVQSP